MFSLSGARSDFETVNKKTPVGMKLVRLRPILNANSIVIDGYEKAAAFLHAIRVGNRQVS